MFDWSYELLPEPEQRLLRCLSLFSGGFTLEAAIAVMGDEPGGAPPVVERVANLASKSLLTLDRFADAGRWRLLETTRAYALEKLEERGEKQPAARRHAEFYRDDFAAIDMRQRSRCSRGGRGWCALWRRDGVRGTSVMRFPPARHGRDGTPVQQNLES